MGQCTGCHQNKVKPKEQSQAISNNLESTRINILNYIHDLHLISLDCMEGIEKSIIQNDRDSAVLLRLKYIYLKEKSGVLQNLIKNIDELKPVDKAKKKKETIMQSELFLQSIDKILMSKDVEKILTDREYCREVSEIIEKQNLNKDEAEKFIDNEIRERNSSPSRKNRRRYSNKRRTH